MDKPQEYYHRIRLGQGSAYAEECLRGNFIGVGWLAEQDLTGKFPPNWREFNEKFIPIYLAANPGNGNRAAGLACAALHTVCKWIEQGYIVLCPDGKGNYLVGEVTGDYFYKKGEILPHRRNVKWLPVVIPRSEMSDGLRNSTGSGGTVCDVNKHAEEIKKFIGGEETQGVIASDVSVEDVHTFGLEKHLEDFLVNNWPGTILDKEYEIFSDEGGQIGQQYPVDAGRIDILAISKDKSEFLVIELKKGRASDKVIGQVQSYMGCVKSEMATAGQKVRGCIIALEEDKRLRYALSVTQDIDFYTYEVSFKLKKN